MTDAPPPGSPRRTPNWVRLALGLSLALNLAVLGIVLGSAGRDRWDDRRGERDAGPRVAEGSRWGGRVAHGGEAGMALSPYVAALPAQDRRAIGREVIGQIRAEGIGLRDLRGSVEAVISGLRAEPFMPEAVASELARQRTALSRVQEVSQEALLARLQAMSGEERRAFADRLEAGLRRRGGPGRDRTTSGAGN